MNTSGIQNDLVGSKLNHSQDIDIKGQRQLLNQKYKNTSSTSFKNQNQSSTQQKLGSSSSRVEGRNQEGGQNQISSERAAANSQRQLVVQQEQMVASNILLLPDDVSEIGDSALVQLHNELHQERAKTAQMKQHLSDVMNFLNLVGVQVDGQLLRDQRYEDLLFKSDNFDLSQVLEVNPLLQQQNRVISFLLSEITLLKDSLA